MKKQLLIVVFSSIAFFVNCADQPQLVTTPYELFALRAKYWDHQFITYSKRKFLTALSGVAAAGFAGYGAYYYTKKQPAHSLQPQGKELPTKEQINAVLINNYLEERTLSSQLKQQFLQGAMVTFSTSMVAAGGMLVLKQANEAYQHLNAWLGLAPFAQFKKLVGQATRLIQDHSRHINWLAQQDAPNDQIFPLIQNLLKSDQDLLARNFIECAVYVTRYTAYYNPHLLKNYEHFQAECCELVSKIIAVTPHDLLNHAQHKGYALLLGSIGLHLDQLGAQFAADLKLDE